MGDAVSNRKRRHGWSLLAALLLGCHLLGVGRAAAQGYNGTLACDCAALEAWPGPSGSSWTLVLFRLRDVRVNDEPDLLYDEPSGPGTAGTDCCVNVAPNWREHAGSPLPEDRVVYVVAEPGVLFMDSVSPYANGLDFGIVNQQGLGALVGRLAPLVRDTACGTAVEWTPVLEVNDVPDSIGCTAAGSWARPFVIGYDVYRLPVSAFPDPTLRDFLSFGFVGFASAEALDFSIADTDGRGGSDLDTTDSVTLRNPDGIPDSGDEVMVYEDCAVQGSRQYWYRIQPVLQGSQAFYETGGTSTRRLPAQRLDLDGNTIPESVDVQLDGTIQFIDPSGRGLGLADGTDILSSRLPGRGIPPEAAIACNGALVTATEIDCSDGVDDDGDTAPDCVDQDCVHEPPCAPVEDCVARSDEDGDTLFECDDADCIGTPPCREPEDCGNGRDDDFDGAVDCADLDCASDPTCANVDTDGDTVVNSQDSAPADPSAHHVPGTVEISVRKVYRGSTRARLAWTDLGPSAGTGTTYDVVTGLVARLVPDDGVSGGTCEVSRAGTPTWDETQAFSPTTRAYWYLVRAENACAPAATTYGADSLGTPRLVTLDCD